MELLNSLTRPLYPVDDIVQLTYWALGSLKRNVILNFFLGLAVLFKRISVCSEKNRAGDKVDDVAAAAEPPMLLIEA